MQCRQTQSKAFVDNKRNRQTTVKGKEICDSNAAEGAKTESIEKEVEDRKTKRSPKKEDKVISVGIIQRVALMRRVVVPTGLTRST